MKQLILDASIVFSFSVIIGLFSASAYLGDVSGDIGWDLSTILILLSFPALSFQIIFYFYVNSIVSNKRSSRKLDPIAVNRWNRLKKFYFIGSSLFCFTDLRNCYFGKKKKSK